MVDSVGRSSGTPLETSWSSGAGESAGISELSSTKLTCDPEDAATSQADGADDWTEGAALLTAEVGSASQLTAAANNNAQRSAARAAELGYAEAGVTSAGDSVFAGIALLKGEHHGGTFEVASASAQVGAQSELQVAAARASLAFGGATTCELRADLPEAHLGLHNPDSSEGVNVGGGLGGVTAECTMTRSGNSLTLGLSASQSAEASVGVRDSDSDGRREYCARLAAQFFVIGGCVELESAVEVLRDLCGAGSSAL